MRVVGGCIMLSGAAVLGICAGQTPAPSSGAGSAPQVLVAPPQVTVAPPRAAFKRTPARSPAASSAPQTGATRSEMEEVTVNGHRSISVHEGARFYVETQIPGSGQAESAMAIASGRVCADQSVPIPKRISSCDMTIWMTRHGVGIENPDLAKTYVARGVAFEDNGDDPAAIKDFRLAAKIDPASATTLDQSGKSLRGACGLSARIGQLRSCHEHCAGRSGRLRQSRCRT